MITLITRVTALARRRYALTVGEVLCRSCRVPVGYTAGQRWSTRNSVYHHPWCAEEPPVTAQQVRNDLWRALHTIYGLGVVEIANLAGVLPSQVSRVLNFEVQ